MAKEASFCHVFLSFRGETRNKFACFLYEALKAQGFVTFMDKTDICVGDEVDLTIKQRIRNSMSAIIIFSQNYAYSTWCLDELVLILERRKSSKYLIIPILYEVEISHIKYQLGNYGLALEKHRARHDDKVEKWREALVEVSNILGYHVEGLQSTFICNTVKLLREKLAVKFPKCCLPTPKPVAPTSSVTKNDKDICPEKYYSQKCCPEKCSPDQCCPQKGSPCPKKCPPSSDKCTQNVAPQCCLPTPKPMAPTSSATKNDKYICPEKYYSQKCCPEKCSPDQCCPQKGSPCPKKCPPSSEKCTQNVAPQCCLPTPKPMAPTSSATKNDKDICPEKYYSQKCCPEKCSPDQCCPQKGSPCPKKCPPSSDKCTQNVAPQCCLPTPKPMAPTSSATKNDKDICPEKYYSQKCCPEKCSPDQCCPQKGSPCPKKCPPSSDKCTQNVAPQCCLPTPKPMAPTSSATKNDKDICPEKYYSQKCCPEKCSPDQCCPQKGSPFPKKCPPSSDKCTQNVAPQCCLPTPKPMAPTSSATKNDKDICPEKYSSQRCCPEKCSPDQCCWQKGSPCPKKCPPSSDKCTPHSGKHRVITFVGKTDATVTSSGAELASQVDKIVHEILLES